MARFKEYALIVMICLLFLTIPACDQDDEDWGQLGMVNYSDFGCWVITEGYDGYGMMRQLEPTNLEDRYRVHELMVRFEYVYDDEWVSVCNAGPPVSITRIAEL